MGFILSPLLAKSDQPVHDLSVESLEKRVRRLEEQTPQFPVELHGVMAGSVQSLLVSHPPPDVKNCSRGAFVFQPEVTFRRSERDEFEAKFGFSAGNGLNPCSPFRLASWGADLEDDVVQINGGNRGYLLTSWYRRSFTVMTVNGTLTGGIIDATDFLNENAFANDEFTQFMNEALVNAPNGFAPSYDLGGALHLQKDAWEVNGVAMRVAKDIHGHASNFYGGQVGGGHRFGFGQGNVRFAYELTNPKCPTQDPAVTKARQALLVSADQELGPAFGIWTRDGVHNKDVLVEYRYLFSGGLLLRGNVWNRPKDEIGIGRAILDKGSMGVSRSDVTEMYIRVPLDEILAVRGDGQYLVDRRGPDSEPEYLRGWILGLTIVATF